MLTELVKGRKLDKCGISPRKRYSL